MPIESTHPTRKLTIVGGGIVGYLEAYFAYCEARKRNEYIRVTIHEKNAKLEETTTAHLVPSLTPDEILKLVNWQTFQDKVNTLFHEPYGMRVEDVDNVNDSEATKQFLKAVDHVTSQDTQATEQRTQLLFEMGQLSMTLWQELYVNADDAMQQILRDSNFHACAEPSLDELDQKAGYRVDLMCEQPNAVEKAMCLQLDYLSKGYRHCTLLSPEETKAHDPFLREFCDTYSEQNMMGQLVWKDNVAAILIPGGCIATPVFLPKLHDYLTDKMGTYVNSEGVEKNCFQVHFGRKVTHVAYEAQSLPYNMNGLGFFGSPDIKHNKHAYPQSSYVFCPGEAVGTLSALGFQEPAHARFAGASLTLTFALPATHKDEFVQLNQYMEIGLHGYGVAWQARREGETIFIGVGGTKAMYGEQEPHNHDAFAKHSHVLQLNIMNKVQPTLVSLALGRDTRGQNLSALDLAELKHQSIADVWVGSRAVAFDGFPTLGPLYHGPDIVENARCTTHLGCGGVSFSPAAALISQGAFREGPRAAVQEQVLQYGSSCRGN